MASPPPAPPHKAAGPGPGPDAKGKGGPGGKGFGGKEGAVATVAGVAVATGIAWSVYRSVMSRKEEEALIEEYYGSRSSRDREYIVPEHDHDHDHDLDHGKDVPTRFKEKAEEVAVEVESEVEAASEAVEKSVEKSWFFGGENKKKPKEPKPKEPKHKPGKIYEIRKGDTLYGISQRYGVSVEALKVANGYVGDLIYSGDKLSIPE